MALTADKTGAVLDTLPHGDVKIASLQAVARAVIDVTQPYRLLEHPFPRVVLTLPSFGCGAYAEILKGTYLEDAIAHVHIGDPLIPRDSFLTTKVAAHLSVGDIFQLDRAIRLFSELHTATLEAVAHRGPRVVINSALVVFSSAQLEAFLGETGVGAEAIREFIDILTLDPTKTFVDLQYFPLVRGTNLTLLPRLMAGSNTIRNTLAARRVRVSGSGDAFNDDVESVCKRNFVRTVANRAVAGGGEVGEVDVAVLSEQTLYLIECKHTLFGGSVHEQFEQWDDICKAVGQLRKCERILSKPTKRHQLLTQWFGVNDVEAIRVQLVVVTSVRLFAGLDVEGVPVRDWFTFRNFLDKGEVTTTSHEQSSLRTDVWSAWKADVCATHDLDGFLSATGRLAQLRTLWMNHYTAIDIFSEDVILAHETFSASSGLKVDAVTAAMTKLGFRFVRTERRSRPRLRSAEEFGADLREASDDV